MWQVLCEDFFQRWVPADAVKALLDFADAGGTVVVTPNSLRFDEYHRQAKYLDDLGITITAYRRPRVKVGEPSRETDEGAGFLQGLIAKTTSSDVPKEKIATLNEGIFKGARLALEGAGVCQTLELKGGARPVATFADGKPAIVEISRGRGRLLYLAIPLETNSVSALNDFLARKLGVTRLLAVTAPDGRRVPGVEVRSRTTDAGVVAYVWNLSGADQTLRMSPSFPFSAVANLTAETPHRGLTISVPNKETVFLEFRR